MFANALTLLAQGVMSNSIRVIDCAAVLGPDTPIPKLPWEGAHNTPRVEIHNISKYDDRGPFWAWNWLKLGEHTGTHFDAPHHWVTGKIHPDGSTDTIDPKNFIAAANVIDCTAEVNLDNDFLLTADAVKRWEAEHGKIGEGEWVLMRTGWSSRNTDEGAFLNIDERGPRTPGPSSDCIEYLIDKNVLGWGTECASTDAGLAAKFNPPSPAHNLLHKHNRYGLSSLVNLEELPPKGAILIVAPLKIQDGTGSPVRVLALVAE